MLLIDVFDQLMPSNETSATVVANVWTRARLMYPHVFLKNAAKEELLITNIALKFLLDTDAMRF